MGFWSAEKEKRLAFHAEGPFGRYREHGELGRDRRARGGIDDLNRRAGEDGPEAGRDDDDEYDADDGDKNDEDDLFHSAIPHKDQAESYRTVWENQIKKGSG